MISPKTRPYVIAGVHLWRWVAVAVVIGIWLGFVVPT